MPAQHTNINDAIDLGSIGYRPTPRMDGIANENAVQVSLISLDDINEALRVEWRALSNAAVTPNPNFAPWFLEPAMRHLDPSREVRLSLLRWGKTKLLVGLAPLVLSKRFAKLPLRHLRIWMPQHCYNGAPIIREGFETAVYSGLFDWLDTRPLGASSIRFSSLPLDRLTYRAIEEACDLRARSFRVPRWTARHLPDPKVMSRDDVLGFSRCQHHPLAVTSEAERPPIVNINIPAKRLVNISLPRMAALADKYRME